MDFKQFVQEKLVPSYFMSVCCIALAMGVIGTIFEPDVRIGYDVLFSPFLYGLVAALIQLVSYAPRELTPRQASLRKMLHIILLEVGIMGMLLWLGALTSAGITLALALSIPVIYALVSLMTWLNDRRATDAINSALKVLQQRRTEESTRP